jgi:RND superfamily putative drug exporter
MFAAVTGWSIRRPLLVVVLWLTAVTTSFTVGIGVFERLVSDVGMVPGSESERAYIMIGQAGPEPIMLTAIVHDHLVTDPAVRTQVDAAVTDLLAIPGVLEVAPPVASTVTGRAVLLRVRIEPGRSANEAARAVAQRLHRITTGTVTVAGGPLTADEFNAQAQADVQRAEMLTTPVVLLLLLLVFGGLVAAGLPLIIAVTGVGGTFGILYAYSQVGDVSVYAIQVATILSVGLAVDYGLLMVSRFKEERATDPDVRAAVARTVRTAGRTVAYSGLTVAAVLAGLTVFPEPFLRSMGLAGIGVVVVVVAASLTLLPGLLTVVGHRIKPAKPAPGGAVVFARIARGVQRRPVLMLLAAAGVMATLTLPVLDLRLAQVDERMLPTGTQTRQVYDATVAHFPDMVQHGQIVVAVAAPSHTLEVNDLHGRIAAVPHVTGVEVTPAGPVTVLRAGIDQPAYSDAARRAVETIRGLDASVEVAVTGDTALLVDYQATIVDHLPYAVSIIAAGTLVLLFLFTGSVLLPVKAVLTNVLSIGAALGAVVWVFQQGHLATWFAKLASGTMSSNGTTRLDATHVSVPVLVAAIAFALSVDYEVFLLSRIRERWLSTGDASHAVAEGLQRTGRIITSAALLLCVVFVGFLVAGFVPVQAIGLGLVLAVALDATIVRLLLVPATMTLAGRYNWWAPRPLRRLHARFAMQEPPSSSSDAAPRPKA